MHDAIEAERRGIPSVAVITDRFAQSARVVARVNGIADYPFVILGHPVADNDDATLRAKAEAAIPGIVAILTERKP